MKRLLWLSLLTVAFFLGGRAQETGYALLMESGGSLSVCNNVVVNNYGDQSNVTTGYNLFGVYNNLFYDKYTNFRIANPVYVYNLGNNDCSLSWLYDLAGNLRISNDTTDLGVFEYAIFVTYPVFQESNGNLTFCNNIIVNNYADTNVNVQVPTDNYVTDNDTLFVHKFERFEPRPGTPVLNAGQNSCSTFGTDLRGDDRVMDEIVDLGAYERRTYQEPYPVWQETGGGLTFCNNIIINNNKDVCMNVSVPAFNYVTDGDNVFENSYKNFSLLQTSPAVDAGQSSCTSYAQDIMGDERVLGTAIDMGAFELRVNADRFPVFQEESGNLSFCNNIIVGNYSETNVNVTLSQYNLLDNSVEVFVNPISNFSLQIGCAAVDVGQNSCSGFMYDLLGDTRIQYETVDLGAFEVRLPVVQYPVLQEEGGTLTFCDNIIINNHFVPNVNVTLPQNNLVTNIPDVFVHEMKNFMLADNSPAENAGDNSCLTFNVDMRGAGRIDGEAVDQGAFETLHLPQPYAVYQEDNGNLQFCNNLIINNYADSIMNVEAPEYNLVGDTTGVLVDDYQDFRLMTGSAAVDAGLNACSTWDNDVNGLLRVQREVVDLGAFELEDVDNGAIVYQESGSELNICNNVIILNSRYTPNTNVEEPSEDNIIDDEVEVFRNVQYDFRPLQQSAAVDAGNNSCNTLLTDLDTVKRISNGTIDIGAFEIPEIDSNYYAGGGGTIVPGDVEDPNFNAVVWERSTASLMLCDNIIAYNDENLPSTNTWYGQDTNYRNIITDEAGIFRFQTSDFRIYPGSPAFNRGRNDCNTLSKDLDKQERIVYDTIDIGAFEYSPYPDVFVVFQKEGHQMTLCNNIIINNNNVFSVNDMNTPSNNLLVDNDLVFMDNSEDYRLREQSPAVNRGDNSCCPLTLDLAEEDRIYADTIDIGAFEYIALTEDTVYVIFHHEGHQLTLCNNIVINNFDTYPTNDPDVSGDNLLVDNDLIFKNNDYDFTLREHAAVVNAGINSCNSLTTDLKDEVRIFGDTIDYGAFEVLSMIEDTSYVVFQKNGHQLQLCNNIIINNADYVYPVNIWDVPSNNMLADNNLIFRDNMSDFRLREQSAAVNVGLNSCNPLSEDMKNDARIYDDIIDLGVFELIGTSEDSVFAVLSKPGHQLLVCNNIIINNVNVENVNIPVDVTNNIIEDSEEVFLNSDFDFRPFRFSQAVNHGNNSCCSLPLDMEGGSRVYEEVIDIGAYEPQAEESDTSFVVFDTDSGSLVICNNIIINNHLAGNLNVEVSAYNIVEDNDTLFRNNVYDFRPFYHTIAVNQGDNACVSWDLDMEMNVRIAEDVVEIGAFELYVDTTNIHYAVFMDGDTLGGGPVDPSQMIRMYNTIVINNPCHTANVSESVVGDHNLLTDVSGVFVEERTDYTLLIHSPAVDAGDNQWVDWPKDLKDDGRISCANIVDQGAYEYAFLDSAVTVIVSQVPSDNCQGSNFALTALPGAMHYYWSHSNEDTNEVQVSPLSPTDYTVIVTSGGECYDTVTTHVEPSMTMSDSLGSPASVGTTFWLSYLRNHFRAPTLMLNISAEEACSGTVSNPRTGWDTTFSVGAHSVVTVTVPVEEAYPEEADVVGDYGILVQATDSISLYAANYNSSSFDVTVVLPVEALSDEYVLQTYTPMVNAEFIVVAVEDNTVVDITPARALQGGHAAQQTFSVTLQAGQTYFGVSKFGGVLGDLSGTVIQAQDNKPVAVFNGNICALVPTQNSYSDHLVEQAVGVKYWGRSFAITSTESQNFDRVRVTTLRNGTEVRKNGTLLTTLQAFQTYEFQLSGTEGSCYLETTNPVGVYLYIAGAVQGNPEEKSDPSMVWIPPTEQMLMDVTFATFDSPGIVDHYVNIVVPAGSVQEVMLDGVHIGNQFTLLNGSSNYAFLRKQITNGTHSLQCEGGFIAHCYGLGFHESYGYATGSKAVPLKEQLFVNGIPSNELPPDMRFCPYEPIPLSVYVNYPCDSIVWDFGDNTPTVNAYETVHDYAGAGHYPVSATLYITSNGTVFCSDMHAWVNVDEGTTVTIYETICQGETYQQYGFDIQGDVSGHRTETRKVLLDGEYCDSTYVLELDILNSYFIVSDTICAQNTYSGYGFDITPMEPGVVQDTINVGEGSTGCDSLVILQLVVTPNNDMLPVIEGETYPCMGGEYTYSIDPLSGLQDVVWTVPDSLIVMPGQDPYSITLLFGAYAESMEICVSAMGGCGELQWCRTIFPQDYTYVQLMDTLCSTTTEYNRYGFELTNVSDSNDLFIHHDFSSGGCDSTTVLRLVFLQAFEEIDTLFVCENDFPYLYHDTLIPQPGDYSMQFVSSLGCDSLLTLTVYSKPTTESLVDTTVCDSLVWIEGVTYFASVDTNYVLVAANGCDSVVQLHLTVNYSSYDVLNQTVCNSFEWHGTTYTESGIHTYEYTNESGCPSVDTLHLTVSTTEFSEFAETACEEFEWGGETYAISGDYTQTFTNAAGCDSVVTLHLTVNHGTFNSTDETVCESYDWNGTTYAESGTYIHEYTNDEGCESADTLHLTVNHGTFNATDETACESYDWNGTTYSESGTYTYEYTNDEGCSSADTLHLIVNHGTFNSSDETACESYEWNGTTYSESGTYTYEYTNDEGCASADTLHLTVKHGTFNSTDETACESYEWNGTTYSESGTYTYEYTNDEGCSSADTLHLTVNHGTFNATDETACESYDWNGTTYSESGTYTYEYTNDEGCASADTLHLIVNHGTFNSSDETACESYDWNGTTYSESGTYTYEYTNDEGCASADTLHLTISPADNTEFAETACESYTWNGTTYAESGDYTQTLTNAASCDSIVTLHLTVNYGTHEIQTESACENYDWHGTTYSESGTYTYEYTNDDGCASVDTLHLTISPADNTEFAETACESYTWNGTAYAESGDYTQTLTNAAGCDSVVTLHLTVNYGTHESQSESACENYDWHGTIYSESGTYTYEYTNDDGCASVDTLHLTISPADNTEFAETACESYTWNGTAYAESGDYTQTLTNAAGCDSIVTLHLTVNYGTHESQSESACENYDWHGTMYTESGTYTYEYTNDDGCASVDTLHLTISPADNTEFAETACESYTWNGTAYAESGDYTQTLTNAAGCDSIVTLHLTVNYGTHETQTESACESYDWNGTTYSESGTYTYEYTNDDGCASVDTLHLTISPADNTEFAETACESYTWNGTTYAESGDYTQTLTNAAGCDSIVTLHLTVNYGTHETQTESACENYDWHGTIYSESGTYTYEYTNDEGCASADTLHLTISPADNTEFAETACESYTWNGTAYAESGDYTQTLTNAAGCDSVVTLHLTVNHGTFNSTDETACESYDWNGTTYSESGTYTYEYTNDEGCASADTLHLTINMGTFNATVESACDSFAWHGTTYTQSGTYKYEYTNAAGCESVDTLYLTINYPEHQSQTMTAYDLYTWMEGNEETYTESGTYYHSHIDENGCEQVDTLHLTVYYSSNNEFSAVACDSYEWDGEIYTESGDYGRHYTDIHGADSIVALHLTIYHGTFNATAKTACDSYEWHDTTYTESGTYLYEYINAAGCESVDTLCLTISPADSTEFAETACESYTWNGTTYAETGDYTQTLNNAIGCDSVVTLHLTVNHGTHNAVTETVCNSYEWNGTTYTESGVYTYEYTNDEGCASVDTLHLTINMGTFNATVETACDSFEWHGTMYTESGTYTYSYTNADGCESTDTLYLTINYPEHQSQTMTAYDLYTWMEGNEETYTESGTYYHSHIDENGCEQVDTLHLTVYYSSNNEFSAVACDSYEWDGEIYTESGDYGRHYTDIHGADSIVALHLTIYHGTFNATAKTACDSYEWHDTTYTESGTYLYEYINAAGCESVDTLYLTISPADSTEFAETACESYTWHGTTYAESGDYTQTLTNAAGCDSVVTLHLTVNHGTHNAVTETVCNSYEWNGTTYTESGIYTYEYTNDDGCASVDTLHLTINMGTFNATVETACDSFEWHGTMYTESGMYTYSYTNADGCESTDMLYLTINYPEHQSQTMTAYDLYTWMEGNEETYTESGTYYHSHIDENGCEQVDTLHLTVYYSSNNEFSAVACDSYEWDGEIYTESGDYGRHYTDIHGADSIVALHLTIYHGTFNATAKTACDSYEWHDTTYTESGTYLYEYINAAGCESVDTLYLTISPADSTEFAETACESYTWNGTSYTETGDYTQTLTNAAGCDSVVTLHLTVNHGTHNAVTETVCNSYEWNGTTYTESGIYTYEYTNDDGCASVDTLHLTINMGTFNATVETACDSFEWHGTMYTESGTYTYSYTNADGCESTDTLYLTINYPEHQSQTVTAYDQYTWTEGDGETYTTSGTYYYTHTDGNGCEQVDTLHLTIYYSSANEFSAVACDSYEWDGEIYTESGDYGRHYTDIHGADSIVALHLTINHGTHNAVTESACNSFTWHGATYMQSGIYTYLYTNADGCASVDTLYLTINHPEHQSQSVTAYDQYTWTEGDGEAYTTSGTYYYTHIDENGCEQVDTLYLTIYYSSTNEFSAVACEGYEWDGQTYTTSGDYVRTYTDIHGADSVMTLHLTINHGTHETQTESACDSFAWHGTTYTQSGAYTYEYTNADGCASVDTLYLTINHPEHQSQTVTAYDQYTWTEGDGETYTTSGTYYYTHIDENGCEQVDTLYLTIYYSSTNEFSAVACEGYEWDGQTYTTSGDYVRTYTDIHGADSVMTLHLTINHGTHETQTESACDSFTWHGTTYTQSGTYTYEYTNADGCASVDTLYLTINHPEHQSQSVTAYDQYTWTEGDGEAYTTSGTYYYTHIDENGCEQVDTLYLTIYYSSTNEFSAVACEGYEWDGQTYTTSGDYVRTYTDIHGADSVMTLHLTIHYGTHNAQTESACDSFAWHGTTYTQSGAYTYAYTNADGCESTDTLHLTISPADSAEFAEIACESYTWNGTTYAETGDYTQTLTNAAGCDSVVTLHLTVNHGTHNAVTETVCNSYEWNGTTYTESGIYTYEYTNADGCESVDTLHLTISPADSAEFAETACESYTWNGTTYVESGDYTQTLTNAAGCDSIVTLHLTIHYGSHNMQTESACDSFKWHGTTYTQSGTYTYEYTNAAGCESTDTLHLTISPADSAEFAEIACESYTWNGTSYTESGDYTQTLTNAAGCDSVVTLHLTITPLPTLSHTPDTVIHAGDSAHLWASGADVLYWTDTDGNILAAGSSLTVNPANPTMYYLTGQNYSAAMGNNLVVNGDFEQGNIGFNSAYTYVTNYMAWGSYAITTNALWAWGENGQPLYGHGGTGLYMLVDGATTPNFMAWQETVPVTPNTYYAFSTQVASTGSSYDFALLQFSINGTQLGPIFHSPNVLNTWQPFYEVWYSGNNTSATLTILNQNTTTYGNDFGLDDIVFAPLSDCSVIDSVWVSVYNDATIDQRTICENELPYEWNGVLFEHADTVEVVLPSSTGADSTVVMHLTINYGTHNSDTVTACGSHKWHGTTYTMSGIYTYSYANAAGCESTDTLHLTVSSADYAVATEIACEEYEWEGVTYAESGIYTQTLTNASGCDSTVTLHLTIRHGTHNVQTDTACNSYEWYDVTYTLSGTYTYAYMNADSCPSVDTLHLTINYADSAEFTAIACEEYEWGGTVYTETGDYTRTLTNTSGCDSTVTLHLTIHHGTHTVQTETACNSYEWHDVTYNTSGTYTYAYMNADSCPSVDTLHLTINYADSAEFTAIACEEYEWGGTVYTETGDYTRILTNASGCDSTVTLHLTIRHGTHNVQTDTACNSYEWHDVTYTTSGTYTYAYMNADSCPSVDTLHLTINYADSAEFTAIACEEYEWGGTVYTETGDYTRTLTNTSGCDSTVTLHLTIHHGTHNVQTETACNSYEWHDVTYNTSGTYTYAYMNADSCPSVDTLHLTVQPCDVSVIIDSVVCANALPLVWNGMVFTQADTQVVVIPASNGADSIVTMVLHVNLLTDSTIHADVLQNNLPYILNNTPYNTPGTYVQHLTNAAGCDSTLTLVLTVLYNSTTQMDTTLCASALPFTWNDSVFTAAGTKTRIYSASNGADSLVVMTLSLFPQPEAVVTGPTVICDGAPVILTANSAQSYLWSTGATTQSVTVSQEGHYTLLVTNEFGCSDTTFHNVFELLNPIVDAHVSEMCAGGSYLVTVGYQQESNIQLGHGETTLSVADTIFLPDGIYCEPFGCSYQSPVTFTAYADGDTIQSADDIYYVRLNIEHSFIGDLYINITCPNGQKADLLKYGGTGSSECNSQIAPSSRGWMSGDNMSVVNHLGVIHMGSSSSCDPSAYGNEPGTGWNYCWSNNTTQGYTYASGAGGYIYRAGNEHNTIVDSSNVAAGTQFYHPDDSFTSLIGCPLNGSWYIEVQDGWSVDNGYLFGWELALSTDMLPQRNFILENATADGPWITNVSDSLFRIEPPADLAHDTVISYTFTVYDTSGCSYDTTISITFHALPRMEMDTTVCGSLEWNGDVYTESGQYEWTYPTDHCDSTFVLNLTIAEPFESTLEDVVCEGDGYNANGFVVAPMETVGAEELHRELTLQSESGCDSIVHLTLTVIDTALLIVPLTEDFCESQSMELMVVTPMPDYIWSTGESAPTITVTTPGYYSVTATQGDCSATARVLVQGCTYGFYLPNAITPSRGDGQNDYFCIPEAYLDNIALFEISIVNRWGEQVYYSTDKHFKWNGEYRGSIQYQTIYNYVIRYTDTSGRPYTRTGAVTVL